MSQSGVSTRALWSSERGFILSTAAAAVGLGNLWRFPYMAGENGGGAFVLAYVISVVLLGLPLMMLELGLGRRARGNTVAMFRYVHPRAAAFGWVVIGLTTIIMSYYLVITGWTLGYAVASLGGSLLPFAEFTDSYRSLWFFLLTSLITGGIVLKGVTGIEKSARILMPVLLAIVLALALFGLTLPGSGEAIRFLFSPDFSRLIQPRLWLFAVGQAFYSLAIGSGYLITYGSYMGNEVSLQRSSMAVTGMETAVALLAGLMVFPVVFTFGFDPGAGSELAFNTLPAVFGIMGGGVYLAPVFFLLFFAAALSSCVAGVKVIVAAVEEELKASYPRAVHLTTLGLILLGIPSALSFTPLSLSLAGRPFLEVMDMFGATQVLVASGLITGTLISWLIPRERLYQKLKMERPGICLACFVIWIGRYLPVGAIILLLYTWLLA